MEKVLSDEEKIRRAIEISQRRNNYYRTTNVQKENVAINKKEYKLFKKMFIQITICLLIYGAFYLMSNKNYVFSKGVIEKTNFILNYDVNFEELYKKGKNSINNFISKWKTQSYSGEDTEENSNQNLSINENIEEKNEYNNSELSQEQIKSREEEKQEENLSQIEQDAKYVKEHYVFIKPISGKITSKFGEREVLINGMTSDHKGIDIAAKQGTDIEAAIDGQVEEASKNSQYGNFLKIKKDDILTVYAHCKSLKVSKGDNIKQGDVIATVGSTGVATGSHLHFEIRLNNRYIDPELIIEF